MTPERTPFPEWAERMERARQAQFYEEERGSAEWDSSPNPYHHICWVGCECDGRRSLGRLHRDVDLVLWVLFGLCAGLAWWRWG